MNHGRLIGAHLTKSDVRADLARAEYSLREASGILEKYSRADPAPRFRQLLNMCVQLCVHVRKCIATYRDDIGV